MRNRIWTNRRLERGAPCVAMAGTLVALLITPGIAQPRATIRGETDPSGHVYTWRITNHDASPIVKVSIPHYRADLFFAPAGWSTKCTYLVNVGVPDRPGVCEASVAAAEDGIRRDQTLEFGMRIAATGTISGPGTVHVTLADGSTDAIGNVLLPQPPSHTDRLLGLVAFGTVIAVAAAIHLLRRRRRTSR